jgi:hypothetical protein
MEYTPINDESKQQWIDWLTSQQSVLNGKQEVKEQNQIFETPEGDIATGKDLVGNFLALLTNKTITIN